MLPVRIRQTPRLDGAGALITKTGTRLQTSQEARFISWQSVADQTITAEQLKVFAGGTWRLSFWLVGIILFIVLAISLGIFWLIYIWFWAWVLQLPARRMGLRLPKTEMALVMAHICVVPMLIQTVLRLLPGSLTWPFLPTLVTLVFWLAVVKSWPQISGEVDSAGSTEPPINS
ncbi:MAG: hypothetical protein NTV81_00540 [Candidatus Komeilibacteria bacterium]|nr:hypothetical protein [Candidatus Komeilibacteria bacterium]